MTAGAPEPRQHDCAKAQSLFVYLVIALTAEIVLGTSTPGQGLINTAAIGRVLVLFLSLAALQCFAQKGLRSYRPAFRDIVYSAIILIFSILIFKIGLIMAASLAASAERVSHMSAVRIDSYYFAIPFAAGGLLLQTILGWHFALLYAVSLSLVVGFYSPQEPVLMPFVLATTALGSLSIAHLRNRNAYTRAGLNIALVALPIALGAALLEGHFSANDFLLRFFAVFAGGALCSFLAAGFSPVVEHFGGYTTDLTLLEIASLDHPLLKELSVNCPGTWNHSMVMGMIAESAADAIGANPVVTRVGAYFHDVGKIKKPLYFVENQAGQENRHDKLSSSMSALIIRSHVKDGIELARKHGVPRIIEDMIPQHHGTSIIEYFYNKACKELEEAGANPAEVDETLYSYPGPMPQTKEAGILMLADGIEAAARTLEEPTPDRIQGLVQKKLNKVFASGQLDECELTLKDLHLIAKCFTRVLSAIYHQRVAYAEPAEKVSEKPQSRVRVNFEDHEPSHAPLEGNGAPARRSEAQNGSNGKDRKEDLKRLGI